MRNWYSPYSPTVAVLLPPLPRTTALLCIGLSQREAWVTLELLWSYA